MLRLCGHDAKRQGVEPSVTNSSPGFSHQAVHTTVLLNACLASIDLASDNLNRAVSAVEAPRRASTNPARTLSSSSKTVINNGEATDARPEGRSPVAAIP